MGTQQTQQIGTEREGRVEREKRASTDGYESVIATELSKDQAFDVLRNSRRRAVLSSLRTHGGSMSVEELTSRVAAEEYGISAEELTPKQYKRVYTGLYQCHLRRMDELGVIDFEKDDNTVRLRDEASYLEPYLDDGRVRKPSRVELVVSFVALGVVLGILGVTSLGFTSLTPIAALTAVALLGLALFQLAE